MLQQTGNAPGNWERSSKLGMLQQTLPKQCKWQMGSEHNQPGISSQTRRALSFPSPRESIKPTEFPTAVLLRAEATWNTQLIHFRSCFQWEALGTGQGDSKLSNPKLWRSKNTPKMSLLKRSLPFGFQMLSLLPPLVTSLAKSWMLLEKSWAWVGRQENKRKWKSWKLIFHLNLLFFLLIFNKTFYEVYCTAIYFLLGCVIFCDLV